MKICSYCIIKKMKTLFVIVFIISLPFKMAAQDTVKVMIDHKPIVVTVVMADEPAVFQVSHSLISKETACIISVTGPSVNNDAFKHSLELSAGTGELIEETANKPGEFDISNSLRKLQPAKGSSIALYLLLNPSNPSLDIPSRRIFLGNLVLQ